MRDNTYVKLAELHKEALHNALTKGIPFPVDITSDFYSEWRFTKALFERRVKAKYPGEWPIPSLKFLADAATAALSEESLIEAVRLGQLEEPWSGCQEDRHFAAMNRMPSSKVTRAMATLENLLPETQCVAIKNALITLIRNQEMERSVFWVKGSYDQGDGHRGAFLVEASDGSEAMSIVNDYCDRLGDGEAPITGAPDSWTFVPETYEGAADLLEALANMQHPVLSREAISEN